MFTYNGRSKLLRHVPHVDITAQKTQNKSKKALQHTRNHFTCCQNEKLRTIYANSEIILPYSHKTIFTKPCVQQRHVTSQELYI